MSTYSKITRDGQITLPASIRKKLGISEGDLIEIDIVDDKAVLVPKKMIDKSQSYFWTQEWQAAEKEAEEDIKKSRVKKFDSVKELIKELD